MSKIKKLFIGLIAALSLALGVVSGQVVEAEAADRCGIRYAPGNGYSGGCENTGSRVVVRCVDGSRVKYVQSAFGRGWHTAYCNGQWPFGFWRAESAYLRYL